MAIRELISCADYYFFRFHSMTEDALCACKKISSNSMFSLKGSLISRASIQNVQVTISVIHDFLPRHFVAGSASPGSHFVIAPPNCVRIPEIPVGSKFGGGGGASPLGKNVWWSIKGIRKEKIKPHVSPWAFFCS